jgi:hypothetical protein
MGLERHIGLVFLPDSGNDGEARLQNYIRPVTAGNSGRRYSH